LLDGEADIFHRLKTAEAFVQIFYLKKRHNNNEQPQVPASPGHTD
jgi:hypothetical protein